MKNNTVIKVNNLGKTFKLPHEKQSSIKGLLTSIGKRKKTYEIQEALRGVDLEIKKGEFFGIVGRNGSGKSTLLKLLAGIYAPTTGSVKTYGKLTPFIELGVGFNPELSGRENVYLNGALLGFSRKEMDSMYDEIVAFAEIERFMDQKLKNYSSGMQVRLAFSIAIRVHSDILILDEVLAVGDEAFQQKCIDVFENYKALNQTIVLVTHDMETVRRFCSRALLLDKGSIAMIGEPEKIARKYTELNNEDVEQVVAEKNKGSASRFNIKLLDITGKEGHSFVSGDSMKVVLEWPEDIGPVHNVAVGVMKQSGEFIFGANTHKLPARSYSGTVSLEVSLPVAYGKYHVVAGLFGKTPKDVKEYIDQGPQFIIKAKGADVSRALVKLPHIWELKAGRKKYRVEAD